MKKSAKIAFLPLLLGCFILSTSAQVKDSFDLDIQKLSPGYAGANIKDVFNALSIEYAGKGEFETTAEYEARLKRADSNNGRAYAFQIINKRGEMVYDADRQLLTVAIDPDDNHVPSGTIALISLLETKSDSYVASNSSGGATRVERVTGDEWRIAFSNHRYFTQPFITSAAKSIGWDHSEDMIVMQIPMDVSVAKIIKNNLKILSVVQLTKPYISEEQFDLFPKFSYPNEMHLKLHSLNATLLGILIYDETTGEIFGRKKPAGYLK